MLAAAESGVTALDITTLIISVVALVIGALGLGWQVLSHFLSGGRVKVELRLGAVHGSGESMFTAEATQQRAVSSWMRELSGQGYTAPVIVLQVRNVGRLPVTVARWGLKVTPGGVQLTPIAQSVGPALPHRLDAGTSETWAIDAAEVFNLVETTKEVFEHPAVSLFGTAELGDGRAYMTPQRLRF